MLRPQDHLTGRSVKFTSTAELNGRSGLAPFHFFSQESKENTKSFLCGGTLHSRGWPTSRFARMTAVQELGYAWSIGFVKTTPWTSYLGIQNNSI